MSCVTCHDPHETIGWTIGHLRKWYTQKLQVSATALERMYPHRARPVVFDWLTSTHQPTRIAAAGAIGRHQARFAFRALLDQLVAEPSV